MTTTSNESAVEKAELSPKSVPGVLLMASEMLVAVSSLRQWQLYEHRLFMSRTYTGPPLAEVIAAVRTKLESIPEYKRYAKAKTEAAEAAEAERVRVIGEAKAERERSAKMDALRAKLQAYADEHGLTLEEARTKGLVHLG